jgi:hypothetical protein
VLKAGVAANLASSLDDRAFEVHQYLSNAESEESNALVECGKKEP